MTLHVKLVTVQQLIKEWGIKSFVNKMMSFHQTPLSASTCYVKCNKKGVINWDKTLVYTLPELIERNDVKIIE